MFLSKWCVYMGGKGGSIQLPRTSIYIHSCIEYSRGDKTLVSCSYILNIRLSFCFSDPPSLASVIIQNTKELVKYFLYFFL